MVNKTQFYKTKVAVAVVLSLGLAACGDSEGDASNSSATTVTEAPDNTVEQVNGTGSVQGTVLDTNGLPVMGATVSLAGQSVETDASGYYHFTGVPLPGVDGVNGETPDLDTGATSSATYLVTITGPEGYASATVNVQAEDIQVDSGNNGTNANDTQTEASAEQTTWFDGFLAQADTANLPKYAASVVGVLRDCDTGATLPAGVKIGLDFTAIGATVTGAAAANDVTIGVPVFTTTTDADGGFAFDNLPTDSTLALLIEGYSVAGDNDSVEVSGGLEAVNTTGEGIVNNLGTANVCAITSNDLIDLKVTDLPAVVAEVNDGGRDWGVLNQGVNGEEGIVINFNETIDAAALDIDADGNLNGSVLVKNVSEYITDFTAKIGADGTSIVVTLGAGEGLVKGDKLSIYLPSHNMADLAGNALDDDAAEANDGLEDSNDNAIDQGVYVSIDVSGKAAYLRADLCAYLPPTTETELVAGTWTIDADDSEDAGEDLLATYTAAADLAAAPYASFSDGDELNIDGAGANNIVQLNGDADTAVRLVALGNAVTNSTITVNNDAARLTLDPKDASNVDVDIYRTISGEERKLATFNTSNLAGAAISGIYTTYNQMTSAAFSLDTIEDNDTGIYELVVDGLESGDKIVFAPYDGFGIKGEESKQASVTVTDVIAPTTVIQESYGLGVNGLVYTNSTQIGDGGEHVNAVTAVAGNPLVWVTPRIFAGSEGSWDGAGNRAEEGIFSGLTLDRNEDGTADANENVYGQPHYAAKEAVSADIGVAFSEDLTAVAAGTVAWDATNASSVTAHTAANNVNNDDGNHSVDAAGTNDVVSVSFDDVLALANTDNDSAMSFAGAYSDGSNVARADAQVVFKDAIPPLVTSAELQADSLIITFNEDVDATGAQILAMTVANTVGGGATALSGLITGGIAASDVSVVGNVATIDLTGTGIGFAPLALLFTDATSTSVYNFADVTDGAVRGHAILDFSTIMDTSGFSWDYYTGTASAVTTSGTFAVNTGPSAIGTGRLSMSSAPNFYISDAIGPFAIESTSTIVGSAVASLDGAPVVGALGSKLTVTINLSHPLNFGSFEGVLPAVVGGNYDLSTVLKVGVDGDASGALNDDATDTVFNDAGVNADLLLVGTAVALDNDAVGTGIDHTFLLSEDKKTLTMVFKANAAADQINICSTVMDAGPSTQAGLTAASEVTSDYSKLIDDADFRLTGASCATPYVDLLGADDTATDYDRP